MSHNTCTDVILPYHTIPGLINAVSAPVAAVMLVEALLSPTPTGLNEISAAVAQAAVLAMHTFCASISPNSPTLSEPAQHSIQIMTPVLRPAVVTLVNLEATMARV